MTVTVTAAPETSPPDKYGSDPAAFDAAMQAHLTWMTNVAPELNAQNAENNKINAQVNATKSATDASAAIAVTAQQAAQALANYKGLYTSLTGPLNVPASVYHAGEFWSLTANLANVATATPGAHASWVICPAASFVASPNKIPLAGADGLLDASWIAALTRNLINDIGVAGQAGFGVGICPAIPAGYTPMPGCTDKLSANYGNYQYSDGSVMVWVPAFFMRIGHASNPTYLVHGVNSIHILPVSAFPDDATANADGYWRHRAFVNAGANQLGFFRDKYDCSQNGTVASSIAMAMPMVSGPDLAGVPQVGFTGCTANGQTPANAYYGALQAAKSRGAKFFPESVFIADALCRISEAHAQAATSTTYCAWYDASGVRNYPKGNDNNALKSEADVLQNGASAVSFTSAGSTTWPNFALTGSGSNLAKTTHNGQACGVADVAGNISKINPGLTCIATAKAITAATQTNPVTLTVAAHGRTTGDYVQVGGVAGMTQLNDKIYTCTVVGANALSLDGVDGTGFTPYTSGGTVTSGTFYTLKPSVDIAAVTSGNSSATDHWGATGVAAQFDALALKFATTYPNNGYGLRYGNGANAVFDMSTAANRALAFAGVPAASGMSAAGSSIFGADAYYQHMRDLLCVISRGSWSNGSNAGSRLRLLNSYRTVAYSYVGFACASYLP